jgi:tetratricopeptide (TPR) repeat protein
MLATSRAVLIHYSRDGKPRHASGLRVGGRYVLTADHCADGTGHNVAVAGDDYPARVFVRGRSPDVDLAILEVPDLPEVPPMRCARADRTLAQDIHGCIALGYPVWKRNRVVAQVEGDVPTGEDLDPKGPAEAVTPLTLKITNQDIRDRQVLRGDLDQHGSQWAGMSGAVVVTCDDQVVAVVRSHSPAEGVGSLTLTPVDAIASLPADRAARFWAALGLSGLSDLQVLPAPGEPARARPAAGQAARPAPAPADSAREAPTALDAAVKFLGMPDGGYEWFVGRAEALACLDAAFARYQQQNSSFACLLTGRTGIGKTSLAQYFAFRKSAQIRGKVIKVDVHGQDISASIQYLAEYGRTTQQDEIANQAPSILRQIPPDSILILDDVGQLAGHEAFAGLRWRFFLIVISSAEPVSALMSSLGGRCEQLELTELSEDECETLFRKRLHAMIVQKFDQAGRDFSSLLTTPIQRSPFFVLQVCHVIEEFYFDRHVRKIPELITHTREQISEETRGILEFLFSKVAEVPDAQQLILACSLFSPGKIPLDLLIEVAGLSPGDASPALDRVVQQGWLSGPDSEAGRQWVWMHSIYHEYARHQFRSQPPQQQDRLKQAYVRAWFRVLMESRSIQDLWGMHEDFVLAIRWLRQLEQPAELIKSIAKLDSAQILALQKVVPPKDRIDFYWTLLKAESDHVKIADILAALAESLLRAGNTAVAESLASQSLYWYDRTGDILQAAEVRRRLGTIYRTEGDFARSLAEYEEALAVYQEQDDDLACADIDRQKAQTHLEAGDIQSALESLREAETILRELIDQGNPRHEVRTSLAYILSTMADVYSRLDDLANAEQAARQAIEIHTQEVGASHYYTGYDMRCLAKVRIRQGRLDEAIELLEAAADISRSFFGRSLSSAVIDLTIAEAQLMANRPEPAETLARKALEVFSNSMQKQNKFMAYAHRMIAEAQLMKNRLDEACAALSESKRILAERHMSDSPHATQIKIVEGRISLARKDTGQAEQLFWEARSDFLRFGMTAQVKAVDKLIAEAILAHGIADWDHSAQPYQKYLEDFPRSLHNLLGGELAGQVTEGLRSSPPATRTVLDLYCGSGFVSRELAKSGLAGLQVAGLDGSPEMIRLSRRWQEAGPGDAYSCYVVPDECSALAGRQFNEVTCHMGLFQNDLRARHFLFQRVLPCLSDNCKIWLSVYAADFKFPACFEQAYPAINQANPFKSVLFARLKEIGYKQGPLPASIAPVLAKEDYDNLAHFLDFYGFRLYPAQEDGISIFPVRRTWKDRIAMTRLPVISQKIFGHTISGRYWSQVAELPDYSDETYGAILRAERVRKLDRTPVIFSHVNLDFQRGDPIRYAVAVALKDADGKVLFVRRGQGARDFHDSWSLCSTFADPGMTLQDCLQESLQRNLGIQPDATRDLAPRSIRFSPRVSKDGEPWVMAMCLYEGCLDGEPRLVTDKYSEMRQEDGPCFIGKLEPDKMGDCSKSYRDLVHWGLID